VAHGTIGVTTGVRAGRAVLAVRNTGPVIPPDQVPWLFQPFQRSGADRTGTREGQGLGLSIVAAIAEAHGAWLRASALTGGGLRVQAGFPPRVSPPPAGVTQAPAVLPPRAAHR
jgi:signal transduction histidine kinase